MGIDLGRTNRTAAVAEPVAAEQEIMPYDIPVSYTHLTLPTT